MRANYAVIEDGVVVNVIVWDGETIIEGLTHDSCVKITGSEWIGWGYDGKVFIAPQESVDLQ